MADLREHAAVGGARLDRLREGKTGQPGRHGNLHGLEDGRYDVHPLHLRAHANAGVTIAGELDDQGHPDELVEDAATVQPSPVVEELLSMVGDEKNERVVVHAGLLQRCHEPAELAITVGDLAVVLRDHPIAIERFEKIGARISGRMSFGRVGREHPVEGGGGL